MFLGGLVIWRTNKQARVARVYSSSAETKFRAHAQSV